MFSRKIDEPVVFWSRATRAQGELLMLEQELIVPLVLLSACASLSLVHDINKTEKRERRRARRGGTVRDQTWREGTASPRLGRDK